MTLRISLGALCLAALANAGCALPQNSPLEHISKIQPVLEPRTNVLPPATMLMHPGPGVDGPGPGVMLAGYHRPIYGPGGYGAGGCAGGPGGPGGGFAMADMLTSQIGFVGPDGMRVRWDVGGRSLFDSEPLVAPGRFNFPQGAIYRLKLTDIPGYPGVELYPTLEVAPTVPRTEAFIAHNYIPFQLTDDDFKQVLSGNFVTKVIYLPDPQYQELALAGVETLVSTRLDPGVDPIVEADRRGSILAIIRLGNKDLQMGGGPGAGDVVQAGYWGPCPPGHPKNSIAAAVGEPTAPPPQFVVGWDIPEYGMPYCGTPIGLPGPPHVPLGVPAGLQRHVIANETHMHIPPPTEAVHIKVAQVPGLSYPKPVDHVKIVERSMVPPVEFQQPCDVAHQVVPGAEGGCPSGACPPGGY
jgi:hypothetical protein